MSHNKFDAHRVQYWLVFGHTAIVLERSADPRTHAQCLYALVHVLRCTSPIVLCESQIMFIDALCSKNSKINFRGYDEKLNNIHLNMYSLL